MFDKLGCYYNKIVKDFQIGFQYISNRWEPFDLQKGKTQKTGLPLFMLYINEINKKTLGYKSITKLSKKVKDELLDTTKNIALKAIQDAYKFTVKFTKTNNASTSNILQFEPYEFVLALFDIKRSMDYLFVKACQIANKNTENTKYVFVSNDRSAICYSILMGNPSILTPKVATTENGDTTEEICKRGEQYFILYDPNSASTSQQPTFSRHHRTQNATQNAKDENDEENVSTFDAEELLKEFGLLNIEPNNFQQNLGDIIKISQVFIKTYETTKQKFKSPKTTKITIPRELIQAFSKGKNQKTVYFENPQVVDMYNICQSLSKIPSSPQTGGSLSKQSILNTKIPLDDIESICEPGSPMYILFHYHSQLSPFISFFWFITYKSLLYFCFGADMYQSKCKIWKDYTEPNATNINKLGRSYSSTLNTRTNDLSQYETKRHIISNSGYAYKTNNNSNKKT